MALAAVQNRSLADEVFFQLIREIFTGRYQIGDTLPPERTLVEVLQVNRHVVREALKRLSQMGIIAISQGGGTRVLDYRLDGGLDLLPWFGRYQNDPFEILMLWRSVLEMRAAIITDMVRLCTLRASQELRDELTQIASDLQAAADNPKQLWELEVRFWYTVSDGADNRAYRLALNTVLTSGTLDRKQTERFSAFETRIAGYRVKLAEAIAAGDAEAAEAEARATTRAGLDAFYERFFGGDVKARPGGMPRPKRRRRKPDAPSGGDSVQTSPRKARSKKAATSKAQAAKTTARPTPKARSAKAKPAKTTARKAKGTAAKSKPAEKTAKKTATRSTSGRSGSARKATRGSTRKGR